MPGSQLSVSLAHRSQSDETDEGGVRRQATTTACPSHVLFLGFHKQLCSSSFLLEMQSCFLKFLELVLTWQDWSNYSKCFTNSCSFQEAQIIFIVNKS